MLKKKFIIFKRGNIYISTLGGCGFWAIKVKKNFEDSKNSPKDIEYHAQLIVLPTSEFIWPFKLKDCERGPKHGSYIILPNEKSIALTQAQIMDLADMSPTLCYLGHPTEQL